jgi:hypothetical protein
MRSAPRRELQDDTRPKLIFHGSSVVETFQEPNEVVSLRRPNGPLYAYALASHPGLPFGHSGEPHHVTTSFSVGPSRKPAALGASEVVGCAGRAQQKGEVIRLSLASTFAPAQLGMQLGMPFLFAMNPCTDAPMQQLALPLLGRLDRPCVAPTQLVLQCTTYREAVRMCWALRRVHHMTLRQLSHESGLRPQFVSDYLHADDGRTRRDLPADQIAAFEAVVGNTLITQWIASRQALTVLEEMQATRAAA